MTVLRSTQFGLLIIVLIQMLGCSTGRLLSPPPQSELIAIEFSDESFSTLLDMPMGVYQVPNSQVIISGHQKVRSIESIIGPSGFNLKTAENADSEDSAIHILKLNLTESAKYMARDLIADPVLSQSYTYLPAKDAPYLDVKTRVILTFENEELSKPYVVLHAALKTGGTNFIIWQGRYIASSGPAKPVTGEDSWMSDDGEALHANISKNLKTAIEVMMRDVASPYPRRANKLVSVKGHYPYVGPQLQIVGYHLDEDANSLTFLPKLGSSMVFAGVNVVDKETVSFRPALADDPVYTNLGSE